MSYRKIWESHYGNIPEGYEIHHIDGNHSNNDIENLQCITIEEHFKIHLDQGDYMACTAIKMRMNITLDERKRIHKLAMEKRDQTGNKNPMYGRSAIREKNMRWYNNGLIDKMFAENTQPNGWVKGRLNVPIYDKSGKNNPRARCVKVNGKEYDCLKDVLIDFPEVPYSTLKTASKNGYSKKYNLKVEFI